MESSPAAFEKRACDSCHHRVVPLSRPQSKLKKNVMLADAIARLGLRRVRLLIGNDPAIYCSTDQHDRRLISVEATSAGAGASKLSNIAMARSAIWSLF
jgi:hypothetical protein